MGINTYKEPVVSMREDCLICKRDILFKIHAETQGQLHYALDFFHQGHDIIQIEKNI